MPEILVLSETLKRVLSDLEIIYTRLPSWDVMFSVTLSPLPVTVPLPWPQACEGHLGPEVRKEL